MRLDRAAWPFVGALAIATMAAGAWRPWVAVLPVALLVFVLQFFRDPERRPPPDADALLSPADGRVIRADRDVVSVFMNVVDVHVCRSPVGGRVATVRHVPGDFLAAWRDDAPECNERTEIDVDAGGTSVRFVLVAGLLARRIVCRVSPGDDLLLGARVGIIRFGSRVDVHLPPESRVAVRVGDRVRAGESVVARRAVSS